MINRDNTVRTIAWKEILPWLSLFRIFRLAVAARVLVLASVGVLLMAFGWAIFAMAFGVQSPATEWLAPFAECPWKAIGAGVPDQAPPIKVTCGRVPGQMWHHDPIVGPWKMLTFPAIAAIRTYPATLSVQGALCILLCALWSLAVWGFFGAAICRIAAVQLAAEEQVGFAAAVRFAYRKWAAYFAAPLFPAGGILLAVIPVAILGFIMRANLGMLLGGLLWPLALLAAVVMVILLLGLLFGWPLMWGAISTEGTDSFDALSRSYAYTFQRPLHYLFYAFVAAFLGWLGWILVQNFAAAVIWLAYWASAWGGCAQELNTLGNAGQKLVGFWSGCVRVVAVGYLFSYFWVASAAIYSLLRRDVDATEMDEVFLDADADEATFDLPKITTDESGAPTVEETAE